MATEENIEQKIRRIFNEFNPSKPGLLEELYADNAEFQDPVVKVKTLKNIRSYYEKAYKNVLSIQFDFHSIKNSGQTYFGVWTMRLSVKGLNSGKPYDVEGLSVLEFNEDNKVIRHRDYLDLGEMVYEKIPLIGRGVLAFKKILQHTS